MASFVVEASTRPVDSPASVERDVVKRGRDQMTNDECRMTNQCAFPRLFQHFLDRRVAGEDAAQSILAQRDHSELDCLFLQRHGRRPFVNQLAERSVTLSNS